MLDGFVYAVGGWEGNSRLDSVECYNPHTNSWQFTESFKMAVTSPAVVALDGLLYVTGRKMQATLAFIFHQSESGACVGLEQVLLIVPWDRSTVNKCFLVNTI